MLSTINNLLLTTTTILHLNSSGPAFCSTLALSTRHVQLWSDTNLAVLIFARIFYLKAEYLSMEESGVGSECGYRISDAYFPIVFHSNYGSVVLSFRDMTTGQTMD